MQVAVKRLRLAGENHAESFVQEIELMRYVISLGIGWTDPTLKPQHGLFGLTANRNQIQGAQTPQYHSVLWGLHRAG